MSYEYYTYSSELYHHGVKGMKWGVRRYQNADGSLTEAGKKRERKQAYKADQKIRRQLESRAYDTGRFSMQYNRKYKDQKDIADHHMSKDMAKRGELSEDTKHRVRSNEVLKQIRDGYAELNREQLKQIEEHVNKMIKDYPEKNIKQTRMYTKDGEQYVNTFADCLNNGNVTYNLAPRHARNAAGEPITYYTPVKVYHY